MRISAIVIVLLAMVSAGFIGIANGYTTTTIYEPFQPNIETQKRLAEKPATKPQAEDPTIKPANVNNTQGASSGSTKGFDPEAPAADVANEEAKGLSLHIAVNRHNTERQIISYSGQSHFHVVINNQSGEDIKFWREWCSWGYFNLAFEMKTEDGKVLQVKKNPRQVWTKNYPDSTKVSHGGMFVVDVYLNQKDLWEGKPDTLPKYANQRQCKVKMRAIYKNAPDEHSKRLGVWSGELKSNWIDVTLYW